MTALICLTLLIVHISVASYLILRLLRYRFEPSSMLIWVLVVAFIPLIGALLYARLGENQVLLRARRKRGIRVRKNAAPGDWNCATSDLGTFQATADVGLKLVDAFVTRGNDITIRYDSEGIHQDWVEAIKGAQRSVHLEYYIWRHDDTGVEIRDVVIERAKAGVECRVLIDAVGSIRLKWAFLQPFHDSGVKLAFFLPLANWKRRWSPHLRNHRKILIIDDQIGYVGSQNISDDDRGLNPLFTPWHNVHLALQGPAVQHLLSVFVDDWTFASGEKMSVSALPAHESNKSDRMVQILATGPDCQQHVLERMLLEALNNARKTIDIATPYFVPSAVLRMAMLQAEMRGVRVRIIVSAVSDEKLALYAGRSFYAELMEEGIEVYEYHAGLLHSKILVVDKAWSMVGSANMDYRSFRLNFEITALLYDPEPAEELVRIFDAYCADAHLVTKEDLAKKKLRQVLLEGAARVLSPQL
jgi:cardiolipin synthase